MASLEAEVFLLGHWKSFDELEEEMSLPELTAALIAKQDSDFRHRKFLAALKGITLDDEKEKGEGSGPDAAFLRAVEAAKDAAKFSEDDIASLQGKEAKKIEFGIGHGIGYSEE